MSVVATPAVRASQENPDQRRTDDAVVNTESGRVNSSPGKALPLR